jgi:hypothetical protein
VFAACHTLYIVVVFPSSSLFQKIKRKVVVPFVAIILLLFFIDVLKVIFVLNKKIFVNLFLALKNIDKKRVN